MQDLSISLPGSYQAPRYLISFDTSKLSSKQTDVLIIGSGVAGLRAALEAIKYTKNVLIITKNISSESSSYYAQGGIAAALSEYDSIGLHVKDTLTTSFGLADENVVQEVIEEGVERVRELIDWGVHFDRSEKQLTFAREGGHSLARVLHRGDETGIELQTSLQKLARKSSIKILEKTFVVDLLTQRNSCLGAICMDKNDKVFAIFAKKTIIATGGIGQLYRETTNPSVATADGIAYAFRAGTYLCDMEFVQFHPTVLYIAGASRALISEAVRGAGGVLRDKSGKTFMKDYHPMADLAPRDFVSRAIIKQMIKTNDTQVYLDVSTIGQDRIKNDFPGLYNLCKKFNIDVTRSWIPVRPAAHYVIGGIKTDQNGRTNIENLYACGECASTNFHGANRLASNSLLECVVFGARAGAAAARTLARGNFPAIKIRDAAKKSIAGYLDIQDMLNSLKSLMWRNAGMQRDEGGLKYAIEQILFWSKYVSRAQFESRSGLELQNMLQGALLIALSAQTRIENRGVHYRTDYPSMDKKWQRHIIISR